MGTFGKDGLYLGAVSQLHWSVLAHMPIVSACPQEAFEGKENRNCNGNNNGNRSQRKK